MQYSEGRLGRIFVVRIDDGEDLIEQLLHFIAEKGVGSAMIHLLGALKVARLVTGPERPVIPPTAHYEDVEGGWEIVGLGTVYPSEEGPKIHLHASIGRGKEVLTGCVRDLAETYLVVEAVILEFEGLKASRHLDEKTSLHLPDLERPFP